jgi:hypothetical protein
MADGRNGGREELGALILRSVFLIQRGFVV